MLKRTLSSLLLLLLLVGAFSSGGCAHSCAHPPGDAPMDYRQEMRAFVEGISAYAKAINPSFIVIPQNGQELLTQDGTPSGGAPTGPLAREYVAAIDGIGREDLFYGYDADDAPTPERITQQWLPFMDLAEAEGLSVLVTDYCVKHAYVDDSYARSAEHGYISYAADHRDLDDVPSYPAQLIGVNRDDITSLAEAKNFLYIINPGGFPDKGSFLRAIGDTNFDLVLIDMFDNDGNPLSRADVSSLKVKKNGGKRLVIAYMSIGEAEDYRYYWDPSWNIEPPAWLEEENPNWEGNYVVRYWDKDWQRIIYGNDDSYLKRIIAAGFDGVYLDIIDAFEYFENEM